MENRKHWRVILLVVTALALIGGTTYSQKRRGQHQDMPKYDSAAEVTLKGTVTKVESHVGRMGWNGTHLVVRFGAETLNVHVGPTNYLAQQGFSFTASEEIEVTGSRTKVGASDVLIAREIRKGEKSLTLRNSQGIPAWSRSKWRW